MALIFNELVSNSIKHGFKNSEKGKISIIINGNSEKISLSYSDSGTWVEPKEETTLGLELIDSLTTQLNGEFTRNVEKGAAYNFIFTVD